jgi:hypothetical protein
VPVESVAETLAVLVERPARGALEVR